MTNGTDAAWGALTTYDDRRKALDAERDAADMAMLNAPVLTLSDARRKLEAAEQHVHPDDADDWAWKLVRAALDGLRSLS